ncbi:MAG: MBL fold metallo-hydrolase [Tannerellaceae bacterium]|jgi:glyoxylase-like metal-dependent hydrolase (beta-lactamase superfamily II)|nr:MBL fold metallo-hydrolase [Tannerellaceae bacterium]
MKKIKLIGLLWISCFYAYSQEVFKNEELSISRLEKNVYVVETSDKTTMYIIEGNHKSVLIDTGTKCRALDSIVGLITQKPLMVIATHAHPDHIGNIGYFREIYIHPADNELLKSYNYKGKVNYLYVGDVIDLGGTRLEVDLMPGHTPGSIILIDRAEAIAYTGDAFGSGQVWMQLKPHIPMAMYYESCKRMLTWMDKGITKIYCGHYPHVKRALDKAYMLTMTALARRLGEEDTEGAVPAPYAKVGAMGATNPMMLSDGAVAIVYDPEHIN